MRTVLITAALMALAPGVARADKLGDHPAIVVQRLYATQGYDYASKFYPHPAWLYLYSEPSHPMMEHPAVLVKRQQQEREDPERQAAQKMAPTTLTQR